MKVIKTLLLTILIVSTNAEPFIIFLSLAVKLLTTGVAITATVLTTLLKLKVVITSIKIFTLRSQIDGIKKMTGSITNFVFDEADSDLMDLKINAINQSKEALEKYRNFQRGSENICRNFFVNKIQRLFYNENRENIDHDSIKNFLKTKNIIKTLKKTPTSEEAFIAFKFNEIININTLENNSKSIITQGIEEIQEEISQQIDETKQEIKQEISDRIISTAKSALLSSFGVADPTEFYNNLKSTANGYKEIQNDIQNVQNSFDNLGETIKNKIQDEANGIYQSLKSGFDDASNFASEKYSRYFGEAHLEENDLFFMCDMVYVISISVESGQEFCVDVDFLDADVWEEVNGYGDLINFFQQNGIANRKQICFDLRMIDEINENLERVQDEEDEYKRYLEEKWKDGFYNYYMAEPKVQKEFLDTFGIFYNSFKSLYSIGLDPHFVVGRRILI